MNIKFILVAATLALLKPAAAVVCIASGHTSPSTCNNYTHVYDTGLNNQQLSTGTWMVWGCTGGTVSRFAGISYCSDVSGSVYQQGNPGNASGQYCWCALTSPSLSAWVFRDANSGTFTCSLDCAFYCAHNAVFNSTFRLALFDALGQ